MDKIKFSPVIVVEGASDVALLSSFLDCDIVTTNGSDVPRETIEYLKELSKTRQIVVLTDPDAPGKRIRDLLNEHIPGLLHAFVPKARCIKRHKVGIAESSREDVLEALSHIVPTPVKRGKLAMSDLMDLGLMGASGSEERRHYLEEALHLGHGNAKTLLKRLNACNISKETIAEVLRND